MLNVSVAEPAMVSVDIFSTPSLPGATLLLSGAGTSSFWAIGILHVMIRGVRVHGIAASSGVGTRSSAG